MTRTITDPSELDALPVGSVAVERDGTTWLRWPDEWVSSVESPLAHTDLSPLLSFDVFQSVLSSERKDELLDVMRKKLEQESYDMIVLMVTDVLMEGTNLLFIGSDDTVRSAFSVEPKDNAVFLPGVMSRKKQIIPMLTALWG